MINFSTDLMQILSFKNYEELSGYMADFIANAIKNKPNLVLCMASGSTPALDCRIAGTKTERGQDRLFKIHIHWT